MVPPGKRKYNIFVVLKDGANKHKEEVKEVLYTDFHKLIL